MSPFSVALQLNPSKVPGAKETTTVYPRHVTRKVRTTMDPRTNPVLKSFLAGKPQWLHITNNNLAISLFLLVRFLFRYLQYNPVPASGPGQDAVAAERKFLLPNRFDQTHRPTIKRCWGHLCPKYFHGCPPSPDENPDHGWGD